ncbi:hypothetical protein JTE90_019428 [Oedothorax gibbosus]|uniref:Tubulin-specific chaperone A n=1 Tax=Oedothorax gibbosus TaxID=931172 RepID=A0AAV6TVE4_9ARAC|nr:hypothetical protein JTE90_019428 [Oedothorax gibbosus]
MATNDALVNLKRRCSTIRAAVTRFVAKVNEVPQYTNIDYELQRLEEKAEELNSVDKEIHMLLTDVEYEQDIVDCEKYEDNAKLTIFLAKKIREGSDKLHNHEYFGCLRSFDTYSNASDTLLLKT